MAQTTISKRHTHEIEHDGKRHLLEQRFFFAELDRGDTFFCMPDKGTLAPVKRTLASKKFVCEDYLYGDYKCLCLTNMVEVVSTVEDSSYQYYPLIWQVVGTVEL